MKIDVSDIRKQIGLSCEHSFEEEIEVEEENLLKIYSTITFTNTGKYILTEGILKSSIELVCSRCLKNFIFTLNIPILEQFQDKSVTPYVHNLKESEDMEDINEFLDNIIDMYDIFRQNIILNIPIKPLCRDECLGLCMKCGKDLNSGKCECK